MIGHYSVYNPRGEKIADCGAERDAVNLIRMRNNRWEGHYYTFTPALGDIVDVTSRYRLEAVEVSYDPIQVQDTLPENQQEPLDL